MKTFSYLQQQHTPVELQISTNGPKTAPSNDYKSHGSP